MPKLKYIGKGAFLPDVPARDLSAEEVSKYAVVWLISSGLYDFVDEKPAPRKKAVKAKED